MQNKKIEIGKIENLNSEKLSIDFVDVDEKGRTDKLAGTVPPGQLCGVYI